MNQPCDLQGQAAQTGAMVLPAREIETRILSNPVVDAKTNEYLTPPGSIYDALDCERVQEAALILGLALQLHAREHPNSPKRCTNSSRRVTCRRFRPIHSAKESRFTTGPTPIHGKAQSSGASGSTESTNKESSMPPESPARTSATGSLRFPRPRIPPRTNSSSLVREPECLCWRTLTPLFALCLAAIFASPTSMLLHGRLSRRPS